VGSPGSESQQPLGGRLFGLSTPCGRGGTSSWPPCTRRRCGQTALRSVPSPPRAAGNSVLGLGAGPGRSRSSSGRGRCPLPKERGAETPGRTPRPDVQAAVVTGRRIRKHGRGPCPREPHRRTLTIGCGSSSGLATSDAFGCHLIAERGRSRHTVRAYLGDAWSLLDHAAATTVR